MKQYKYDNPVRLAELKPADTLKSIGLKEDSVFCDIGAGTGVFSFHAAGITRNTVYAVEISEEMIEVLHERNNAANVKILSSLSQIPSGSCDLIFMCAVIHEVDDVAQVLSECARISKNGGSIAVIEFHKKQTPMGPPLKERLSEESVIDALQQGGFHVRTAYPLGENYYCVCARSNF